jgi:DNA (cytosine-5)-methyltransferase 1
MKYLSLCSGIEAATVAWHPLGWEAVAYSEIERFPSEVLAHHYPNTPNLGDMTKFKEWTNVSNVDVLVGGTPCQSFSVAGLRKGLDDPRGNLMLTYLAIADKYRPKWLVWENVPGVLSSNGGHDFASFLRGLGELGYGFAYRVLDAQYFGVAQRRRRVFVVGYLGDWQRAAAVLFERDSLCGNPAPSRQKREGVAGTITTRTGVSRNNHEECVTWPAEISSTLDTTFGTKMGLENQHVNAGCPLFVPAKGFYETGFAQYKQSDVGGTIKASGGVMGGGSETFLAQPIATHDVAGTMLSCNTSGGFSNSIDHAAGGYMAIQPMPINTMVALRHEALGEGTGFGIGAAGDPAYTITKGHSHAVAQPIPIHDQATRHAGKNGDKTIGKGNGLGIGQPGDPMNTLTKGDHHAVFQTMAVRRLTPVECERLQGFPDTYTDIKSKGKATPDGPRYKALGNSMAVPVMAWIGKRINEVEHLCKPNK